MGPQPDVLPSLLFNEGLVERQAGNIDAARDYFERSLALRPNEDVRDALNSLPAVTQDPWR